MWMATKEMMLLSTEKKYLRKMCAIGFLNQANAPTTETAGYLPADLEPLSQERIPKTTVIFHDESTFQANDDENWMWGEKGQHVLKPKSRGAGIMMSDL